MRTEELVRQLATSGTAVDHAATQWRFWAPLAIGTAVTLTLVLAIYGLRADWRTAAELPMFWMKLAFPAATALAAAALLYRLGQPGARTTVATSVVGLPIALVWMMAAAVLATAAPGDRLASVMGSSWLTCVTSIPLLSVPAFALAFRAARSLAPTRLTLTGGVAGLVAGAAAALAYALYCDEMQAPFLAIWYVLGMAVPAALGSVVGPRLLRW